MKKIVSVLLVLMLTLGLCACSPTTSGDHQAEGTQGELYTVYCNDGTVKQMTAKQLVDMSNNEGRNFEELMHGALISGTGTVSSVGNIEAENYSYPGMVPIAWGQDIRVENGKVIVTTFFAPKNNYVELYSGDKVTFQGTLSVYMGVVYIATHYQMEETYLRYAG